MKTEHFKVFLEKHAEHHYKAGIYDCLNQLCDSLESAKNQMEKSKEEMVKAAKQCGIEVIK